MIRITFAAANQVEGLLSFYLYEVDPPRPEAALALLADLAEARTLIEADPRIGKTFPAVYRELSRYAFLWLRVRAYWISWTGLPDGPVITNVFHAAADIESRATPDVGNIQDDWPGSWRQRAMCRNQVPSSTTVTF